MSTTAFRSERGLFAGALKRLAAASFLFTSAGAGVYDMACQIALNQRGGLFLQSMFDGISANAGPFVLVALLLGAAGLVVAVMMMVRLKRLLKPLSEIEASSANDPTAILPTVLRLVEDNLASIQALTAKLEQHLIVARAYVQHVGIVKYNAFEDIAGQQSYSLCMLDDHLCGILITHLTGKNSTRGYAVQVDNGEAARKLSEEEKQALAIATGRRSAQEPQSQPAA